MSPDLFEQFQKVLLGKVVKKKVEVSEIYEKVLEDISKNSVDNGGTL